MRLREMAVGLAFAGAFIINPGFVTGCNVVDPYRFDENDVVALVEQANQAGPYFFTDHGDRYEVTFTVRQKQGQDSRSSELEPTSLTRPAYACGQRTFMKSAAACLDTTSAPVEGHAVVRRIAAVSTTFEADVHGEVSIDGKKLDNARLELETGANEPHPFSLGLHSKDGRTFALESITLRAP